MNRLAAIIVVSVSLVPIPSAALDTATRTVCPVRTWVAADLDRFDPGLLQVKFVEGSAVRLDAGRFSDASGLDLAGVNAVIAGTPASQIRPTFPRLDRATARAWKARGEQRSGAAGPDLSLWFTIRVDGGRVAVARLVNALNDCPEVEIAHPVPVPEPAVLKGPRSQAAFCLVGGAGWDGVDAPRGTGISEDGAIGHRAAADRGRAPGGTPDFTGMQDYLYDPPVGLDAPAAWAMSGGRGAGMKFIDVEGGWTFDHEDWDQDNFFFHGGDPNYPSDHGTAVMGEVIGVHNSYGVSGFAPDTLHGGETVSFDPWPDVSAFFQEAVDNLDAGDVWLIELQMFPPDMSATPMEWVQANYDVIWTSAWSRGVVCVEAGANGAQDLDDAVWEGVFDRSVRDSGAIMVGAGTPTTRVAEYFTNYGSRMDVNAWGSQIVTTGYGDLYDGGSLQTEYTADFGGTSGASPMVVGASLCVQGIARAHIGRVLTPIELRTLLHDTGTPHLDPEKEIGPRPDLAAAAEAVLAMADPMVVAGPGPAYGNAPLVRVFPPEDGATFTDEFLAYGVPHNGVNVSCGFVGGTDGAAILTGAGPGPVFGPHVRGFEPDGAPLPGLSFLAYGTNKYGVNVAAGDLDGNGVDEVITGAGPGPVFGPHVRAFAYDGVSAVTPLSGVSFFAYGTPKWGVNVAAGNIDGDAADEIVTGAGPGPVYGPHVRGWNVDGGQAAAMPDVSFLAYGTNKFGVVVSCGDVDGDGIDEIVTAAGPGELFGAHVRGWNVDGGEVAPLPGFSIFAWDPSEFRFGARVFAGADLDGDGRDEIAVGPGPDPSAGTPIRVFRYDGAGVMEWFSLETFEGMTQGVNPAVGWL